MLIRKILVVPIILIFLVFNLYSQDEKIRMPKFEYYPEFNWIIHIGRSGTVYPFCEFKNHRIKSISVFRKTESGKVKIHEYFLDLNGEVSSILHIRNGKRSQSEELRKSLGSVCKKNLLWENKANKKFKFQNKDNKQKGEITILSFSENGML